MMNQLGQQLKRIRLERGLTQREVAEQLGVEQNYISRYESGDRPMDQWVLNEVAQILNVRYVQGFEYLEEEIHSLNPQELFDEILPTKTGYDIAVKYYSLGQKDVMTYFYVGEFSASVYFGRSLPMFEEQYLTKDMVLLAEREGGEYIGYLPYAYENQLPLIEAIREEDGQFVSFEETELFKTLPIRVQQDIKKRFVRWFNLQNEEQLLCLPYDAFKLMSKSC